MLHHHDRSFGCCYISPAHLWLTFSMSHDGALGATCTWRILRKGRRHIAWLESKEVWNEEFQNELLSQNPCVCSSSCFEDCSCKQCMRSEESTWVELEVSFKTHFSSAKLVAPVVVLAAWTYASIDPWLEDGMFCSSACCDESKLCRTKDWLTRFLRLLLLTPPLVALGCTTCVRRTIEQCSSHGSWPLSKLASFWRTTTEHNRMSSNMMVYLLNASWRMWWSLQVLKGLLRSIVWCKARRCYKIHLYEVSPFSCTL